uniref:Uncharacterized protein n=1 Tax=Rhizophora mucronata TaxID=61149 RepID=A0A2P2KY48_RHIMU
MESTSKLTAVVLILHILFLFLQPTLHLEPHLSCRSLVSP